MTLRQRYITAIATVLGLVTAFMLSHGGPASIRGAPGHRWILWTDLPGNPVPSLGVTQCLVCSFRTTNAADDLTIADGGVSFRYGTLRVCADPAPAGGTFKPITADRPGFDVIEDSCVAVAWQTGWNPFEFWVTGQAGDPGGCACAPRGGTCIWNRPNIDGTTTAVPGPQSQTFWAGTFSGGCLPKACSEWSNRQGKPSVDGDDSMPASCK